MANLEPVIPDERPLTPFHDLDHYLSIPRVSGLALSPDGTRLVTTVATLNGKGTEFGTALWELDPAGQKQARRITRSAKGEAGAAFAANGDVFFTSARPDPERKPEGDPVNALWLLPADGGEARVVLNRPGGVGSVLTARNADATFAVAEILAGSADEDDDAERRKSRKDNKVSAILHSEYPVRYWDADLGPGQPRIFAVELEASRTRQARHRGQPPPRWCATSPRTPDPGCAKRKLAVSPDGRTIYASYTKPLAKADSRSILVAVDVASGTTRVLLDQEGMSYFPGPVSPDGNTLAVVSESDSTPHQAPQVKLHLMDVSVGAVSEGVEPGLQADTPGTRLGPLGQARSLAAGRFRPPGHRGRRRRVARFPGQRPVGCR
jgi:hypothetical protein